MFKRHWRAIAGTLSAVYGAGRAALDFIGYIDLIVTHANAASKTWLGRVIDFIFPLPEWTVFPILFGGLGLIWWDVRRTRPVHHHSATVTLQGIQASAVAGDIAMPNLSLKEAVEWVEGWVQRNVTLPTDDITATALQALADAVGLEKIKAFGQYTDMNECLEKIEAISQIPSQFMQNASFSFYDADTPVDAFDGGCAIRSTDEAVYVAVRFYAHEVRGVWPR